MSDELKEDDEQSDDEQSLLSDAPDDDEKSSDDVTATQRGDVNNGASADGIRATQTGGTPTAAVRPLSQDELDANPTAIFKDGKKPKPEIEVEDDTGKDEKLKSPANSEAPPKKKPTIQVTDYDVSSWEAMWKSIFKNLFMGFGNFAGTELGQKIHNTDIAKAIRKFFGTEEPGDAVNKGNETATQQNKGDGNLDPEQGTPGMSVGDGKDSLPKPTDQTEADTADAVTELQVSDKPAEAPKPAAEEPEPIMLEISEAKPKPGFVVAADQSQLPPMTPLSMDGESPEPIKQVPAEQATMLLVEPPAPPPFSNSMSTLAQQQADPVDQATTLPTQAKYDAHTPAQDTEILPKYTAEQEAKARLGFQLVPTDPSPAERLSIPDGERPFPTAAETAVSKPSMSGPRGP